MRFGYARISTAEQDIRLQTDALLNAGCLPQDIFKETASGAKDDRPQLMRLLDRLRSGDELCVWKLDRLGRSLSHLVMLVSNLESKGIGLVSLQDGIDTTTPMGRFTFHLFAAIAEFERELIRERTMAGLTAARARGKIGGRPAGLSKAAKNKAAAAKTLYREGKLSVAEIARQLDISKTSLYKYLRVMNVKIGPPDDIQTTS